jgi:hypothetical protein
MRWCDWLDAEVHLRTHRRWHESPACFDPDPETRHLAALGNAQRHLGKLDERAKASWLVDFATAAEHYQSSPNGPSSGRRWRSSPTVRGRIRKSTRWLSRCGHW